jgi:hypothetical protein
LPGEVAEVISEVADGRTGVNDPFSYCGYKWDECSGNIGRRSWARKMHQSAKNCRTAECAGISPRTGRHMYVNGGNLGDLLTWDEAKVAMKNLAPFGWRLPTKSEMTGVRMAARRADEKDSDPFRQRRLHALFMRAGSDPNPLVAFHEAQEVAVGRNDRLPSPDEVDPFTPVKGGPKPGGPA